MYDVRLHSLRALRGEAERKQRGILKAMRGRGYKGAGGGRRGLPMYDVGCTMYDFGSEARCAEGRRQTGAPGG